MKINRFLTLQNVNKNFFNQKISNHKLSLNNRQNEPLSDLNLQNTTCSKKFFWVLCFFFHLHAQDFDTATSLMCVCVGWKNVKCECNCGCCSRSCLHWCRFDRSSNIPASHSKSLSLFFYRLTSFLIQLGNCNGHQ